MSRAMCIKNKNGMHYGEVVCHVCKNDYKWIEDENADVEVEYISIDGNNTFIDIKVIAKCPSCNYRCPYPFSVKGDEYR